jgi:hypothetical protein
MLVVQVTMAVGMEVDEGLHMVAVPVIFVAPHSVLRHPAHLISIARQHHEFLLPVVAVVVLLTHRGQLSTSLMVQTLL